MNKISADFTPKYITLFALISVTLAGNVLGEALTQEQRLDQLEKQNKQLQARVEELEVKRHQPVNNIKDDWSSRFKVNGFLSAGLTSSDQDSALNYRPNGFNDDNDFNSDSVFGVQATFKINEKLKASAQLVANAWENWDVNLEWGYLSYQPNNDWQFKAGRLRVPFYYYSESLDVGYSYPWVRPPVTLYNNELNNYDGIDFSYRYRTGSATHRISAYLGSFEFDDKSDPSRSAKVKGDDIFGLNVTTNWMNWTFRWAYSHIDVEADMNITYPIDLQTLGLSAQPVTITSSTQLVLSDKLNYNGVTVSYDNGSLFATGEIATIDVEEAKLLSDEVNGVLTLGYRYSKATPFIGYGRSYFKDELPNGSVSRLSNRDYKLNFLGVRYDVHSGVALKLQWDRFYDFEGTAGPFDQAVLIRQGDRFDDVNIYSFVIDAVF